MDVGFHHRGVDAQLLAVFQAELDRTLDHGLVDGLHGGRGEPVEGAVEGVVLGYAMAVEVGKAAPGIAIVDAFAQLAIVPVFDAHEDERAQGLRGGDAAASGFGVLQSASQILAHLLDRRGMVVQESDDTLQERVEVDALVSPFKTICLPPRAICSMPRACSWLPIFSSSTSDFTFVEFSVMART